MTSTQPTVFESSGELTADATKLLKHFARSYLKRCASLDRDDLHQETVLVLLNARNRYDPSRGNLSTWLRFAMRRAVRQLFRGCVRETGERVPLSAGVIACEPDPGEHLDRVDVRRAVRLALDELTAARRSRIVRRFGLDGRAPMSVRKMGTTGASIHCALRMLRVSPWLRSYRPSAN